MMNLLFGMINGGFGDTIFRQIIFGGTDMNIASHTETEENNRKNTKRG